jgi:molybdopterin converting factor subunit 1
MVSVYMKVQLLLFAQAREIVGDGQIGYEIDEGTVVSGLLKKLMNQFPRLKDLEMKVAVNSEYVENTHILHDNDEIAIVPPISGG